MDISNLIDTVPIRDQVASVLRKMILTGELKGNQQIRERDLSKMLNVSTTPIKEALRLLQAEGLIYTKPRSGTFVSNFSKEEMMQVVFMRSALDGIAAYFAAKLASDEDLEELGQIIGHIKKLTNEAGSLDEISIHNELFHETIRDFAQNDYMKNLIHSMREIDHMFRELALNKEPVELKRSFEDHEAIYLAIRNRDAEKAECLMNIHIRRVAKYVVDSYSE